MLGTPGGFLMNCLGAMLPRVGHSDRYLYVHLELTALMMHMERKREQKMLKQNSICLEESHLSIHHDNGQSSKKKAHSL